MAASIFCLGLNHKTAPVEIRERLAFAEVSIPRSLEELRGLEGVDEAVVLSTCNRVEIYGASEDLEGAIERVLQYLLNHFEVSGDEVECYRLLKEEAALHLFEVASGLDSMVLGETEIFGQVKKAYSTASEAGATSRRMNKLFQQSFAIGKLVRSSTEIQQGATSVGSVAVDVAERVFGRLNRSRILIIGAGEMARTTAQSLLSRGASGITVANRSYENAKALASELGGIAVPFEDWEEELVYADVVISSTAAPGHIISAQSVKKAMPKRKAHSLLLIDIAVPRDIDDDVNHVDNVYLYNMDDLQDLANEGRARREKQVALCQGIIRGYLAAKGIEALADIPDRQKKKKREDQSVSQSSGEQTVTQS